MQSKQTAAGEQQVRVVSGVWRRIGALFLDGLVLGVIGMALGAVFYDPFIELGQLGRFVGLSIALPYFALLNSRVGGGQTVGKRILEIRVVNAAGEKVGPGAATFRAGILMLPWGFNGVVLDENMVLLLSAASLCVFGIGISIAYLFFANRRSRQSLHDLAARTWVVPAASTAQPPSALPRVHLFVIMVLLFGSLLLPSAGSKWAAEAPLLAGLTQLQDTIREEIGTNHVSIFRGTTFVMSTSGSGSVDFLEVRVKLNHRVDDFENPARKIASIVLQMDEQLESYDKVIVIVSYGFDILIASMNTSRSFSKNQSEWRTEMAQPI